MYSSPLKSPFKAIPKFYKTISKMTTKVTNKKKKGQRSPEGKLNTPLKNPPKYSPELQAKVDASYANVVSQDDLSAQGNTGIPSNVASIPPDTSEGEDLTKKPSATVHKDSINRNPSQQSSPEGTVPNARRSSQPKDDLANDDPVPTVGQGRPGAQSSNNSSPGSSDEKQVTFADQTTVDEELARSIEADPNYENENFRRGHVKPYDGILKLIHSIIVSVVKVPSKMFTIQNLDDMYLDGASIDIHSHTVWNFRTAHSKSILDKYGMVMSMNLPVEPRDWVIGNLNDETMEWIAMAWHIAMLPLAIQETIRELQVSHQNGEIGRKDMHINSIPFKLALLNKALDAQVNLTNVLMELEDRLFANGSNVMVDVLPALVMKGYRAAPDRVYARDEPLMFPHLSPPGRSTHYEGRWVWTMDTLEPVWMEYDDGEEAQLHVLPPNCPMTTRHWLGRVIPGGIKVKTLANLVDRIGKARTQHGLKAGVGGPWMSGGIHREEDPLPEDSGTTRNLSFNDPNQQTRSPLRYGNMNSVEPVDLPTTIAAKQHASQMAASQTSAGNQSQTAPQDTTDGQHHQQRQSNQSTMHEHGQAYSGQDPTFDSIPTVVQDDHQRVTNLQQQFQNLGTRDATSMSTLRATSAPVSAMGSSQDSYDQNVARFPPNDYSYKRMLYHRQHPTPQQPAPQQSVPQSSQHTVPTAPFFTAPTGHRFAGARVRTNTNNSFGPSPSAFHNSMSTIDHSTMRANTTGLMTQGSATMTAPAVATAVDASGTTDMVPPLSAAKPIPSARNLYGPPMPDIPPRPPGYPDPY